MFRLNLEGKKDEQDKDFLYDALVIGAGASGLTAAIYLARDGWKTVVLEKEAPGGLAASTHLIENYPGFPEGVEGADLMDRFESQAKRFGVELADFEEVESVAKRDDGIFEVRTNIGKTYQSKAVLVATGSLPKHLAVTGAEKYYGKGVSYCATCDGPLYKDQDVAVVGYGDAALQEGQVLLQYASSVTFVYYKPQSAGHAQQILQDQVMTHKKTKGLFSHVVQEIKGESQVTSLLLKDIETEQEKEIDFSAIFVYIGYTPYTDFVQDLLDLDEKGYIITDKEMRTSLAGVFAAGDVRSENLAQVAVAVGDGAKAAVAIREYLHAQ